MFPMIHMSARISVICVVDTYSLMAAYPNPSQDWTTPTTISAENQYLIASSPRGVVSGQGTGALDFAAIPRDVVSFYGLSASTNSDDAVLIYGVKSVSGSVFNAFSYNAVTITGAATANLKSTTNNGLPALFEPLTVASLDAFVRRQGTEVFQLQFALYTMGSDGETQQIFGYYQWDPSITVS